VTLPAEVGTWLALIDAWTPAALLMLGGIFFLAGTVGLLRFPDTLTRLHALTKADNLGLGMICLGLAWQAGFSPPVLKLLLIWLLAMLAGSLSCHLIARYLLRGYEATMRRSKP
jgi:multicomponent Na+:H+ antiporter subunit G